MKKTTLSKLLAVLLCSVMVLSLFACNNEEGITTENNGVESTEGTTAATTEETTEDKTEVTTTATTEVTAVTTEETTEATTETTEATTETTEATTEETTETTEAVDTTPYETVVTDPQVNASYYLSMVHEGLEDKPQFYLNGEMAGHYPNTTTDRKEAAIVFLDSAENGYYMYHVVDTVKVYINLFVDGEYIYPVYATDPVSVWSYDATLGTMVTDCEGAKYFLGSRPSGEFETLAACEVGTEGSYKTVLSVYMVYDENAFVAECYHPYFATAEGHYKPACSLCGKGEGKVNEHDFENLVEEGDTATTYSTRCSICDYLASAYDISNDVNKYIDPTYLDSEKVMLYNIGTDGVLSENGMPFVRYTGNSSGTAAGQVIWTRMGKDSFGNFPASQLKNIEVQGGRYLVFRVRMSNPVASLSFQIGTIKGVVDYENADNIKNKWLSISNPLAVGEWNMLVIDLENPIWNGIWQDSGDGLHNLTYLEMTFYPNADMPFTSEMTCDVSYIAICDTLDELKTLKSDSDVVKMIYTGSAVAEFDLNTGMCAGEHVYDVVDGVEAEACAVCGKDRILVSKIFDPSELTGTNNHYKATPEVIAAIDTEVEFVRYTASAAGGLCNLFNGGAAGANVCKPFAESTGKYIVIKYRTSDMASIVLSVATGDQGPSTKEKNQNKGALPTDWEVAVLDVAQFANYTPDQVDSSLLISMTIYGSGTHHMDIAYIAIITDLSGVAQVATEETFKLYTDWSVAGVDYTTATATPVDTTEG